VEYFKQYRDHKDIRMKNPTLFHIPFVYFYKTRIKSLAALINWIFIYIVPTFTLFVLMAEKSPLVIVSLSYISVILAIYSIYEAGYMQNDTETIKFEINPTLRLSNEQLKYYEEYKSIIYFIRIVFTFLFCMVALVLIDSSREQIFLILSALIMIGITYYFYNQIRNIFTLLLLFVLVSLRYMTPLLLIYEEEWKFYLVLVILLYPVLNLFDWLYKPQFKQYALPFSQATVRILYYSLLSVVFSYLFYTTLYEQYKVALILSAYFLLYRMVFWYIYRRKK